MITEIKPGRNSLGLESLEVLGFNTQEELEAALKPLMEEVQQENYIEV